MGIKIIRLKGLHSNQKGSWDILQKPFFITELSYYEFGPQISQLHLIGSSPNSVWGTTLTHTFNDSLWPWPKSQPCQRTRPEKVAFLDFHGLSHVFFLRNGEVPRHGQGISNWLGKRPKLWFSNSHISGTLQRNFMNFFLVTLLLHLSIWYSLAMSRYLTVSEKKDMAETMEIQKCHFLWSCSLTWLGFRPWP